MKKIIAVFLLIFSLAFSSVGAEISCEVITEDENVVISGHTTSETPYSDVGIFVPRYGQALSDNITSGEIIEKTLYVMQKNADSEGNFSFTLNMAGNPLGRYSFVLTDGSDKINSEFMYASDTEKLKLIGKINEANSGTEISELIDVSSVDADGALAFNLKDEIIFATDNIKVLGIFAVLNEKDKAESIDEFVNKLTVAAVMSALNEGKAIDFNKYSSLLMIDEKYISTYREKISETENNKLAEAFEAKGINTYEGFGKHFKDTLILTVINNVSSWSDADYIIREHGDDIGINVSLYSSFSKNKQLAAQLGENAPYNEISDLVAEYNRIYKKLSAGVSAGSGGGGGNSGGGVKPIGKAEINGEVDNEPISPENFSQSVKVYFKDIDEIPWASEYISELAKKGILAGNGDGMFLPSVEIKREEFVKILVNAFGFESKTKENVFTDVDKNAWYYDYVQTGYSNGIINGYGDNVFGTGRSLSRQELVAIAYRAAKIMDYKFDTEIKNVFADEKEISDYASEAIYAFKNAGILEGTGNNMFEPNGNVTRAQAAKIIYMLMEYGGVL